MNDADQTTLDRAFHNVSLKLAWQQIRDYVDDIKQVLDQIGREQYADKRLIAVAKTDLEKFNAFMCYTSAMGPVWISKAEEKCFRTNEVYLREQCPATQVEGEEA